MKDPHAYVVFWGLIDFSSHLRSPGVLVHDLLEDADVVVDVPKANVGAGRRSHEVLGALEVRHLPRTSRGPYLRTSRGS